MLSLKRITILYLVRGPAIVSNGVVIFERGPNVSGHRGESLLMMYDTDSNELTEFLSLVSIPGAAGISFVDHAATTE